MAWGGISALTSGDPPPEGMASLALHNLQKPDKPSWTSQPCLPTLPSARSFSASSRSSRCRCRRASSACGTSESAAAFRFLHRKRPPLALLCAKGVPSYVPRPFVVLHVEETGGEPAKCEKMDGGTVVAAAAAAVATGCNQALSGAACMAHDAWQEICREFKPRQQLT